MKTLLGSMSIVLALLGLAFVAPRPRAGAGDDVPASRLTWEREVVEQFATLPAQDGGRVKPLDTVAGFRLLKMNARRTVKPPGTESKKWWEFWKRDEKLKPTAWLLDCLFYPELARTYRIFYVRDDAVLTEAGLAFEGRKRTDRYSYDELAPGRPKIFALAARIEDRELRGESELKDRTRLEAQTHALAESMRDFERLITSLDFARQEYAVGGTEGLRTIYGGAKTVTFSRLLEQGDALRELARSLPDHGGAPEPEHDAVMALFGELQAVADASSHALALFAPEAPAKDHPEWLTPGELAYPAIMGTLPVERALPALRALEDLVELRDRRPEFSARSRELHDGLRALAEQRGEYGKIPLEVRFYRLDFFTRALVFFLLGFLGCALGWLAPRVKAFAWLQWGGLGIGTALAVAGIVMRCIIRSRPPISTLYETILFITATAVIAAVVVELLNRQRIALSLAPILGAAGMFLSMKYELKEATTSGDTMPSLVAVLDTNFWLATHVTIINLGYMAGLLASALAHVWLIGKLAGWRRGNKPFYREVTRMTYGVQCFGLLFALVGTILGGIWANYSWGRFWGWDPKENGALLIVLWMLFLLHGRMGGYLREFGFAVASVIGGIVVSFSWWGVNLLGIGLHSYGFTEGVANVLAGFWVLEALLLGSSLVWWMVSGRGERAAAGTVQDEPAPRELASRA